MKKGYVKIGFCLILSLLFSNIQAQTSEMVHFMRYNPWQIYTSPGTFAPCDAYIALPVISNLQAGVYNPTFRYGKLFEKQDGYPTHLTSQRFVNSLSKRNNWLVADFSTEIVGFGFRLNNLFLSFDYRLKANAAFSASKDLFGMVLLGNMAYTDKPADINMQLQVSAYRELSAGAQYRLNEHLSFGARQKFLIGLANINTRKLSAEIATDPTSYSILMKYQVDMNSSCVVPYRINPNIGEQHFELLTDEFALGNIYKNFGLGWDFGVQYRFNDHYTLTASVLDLGFISWKSSAYKLSGEVKDNGDRYQDGGFLFAGFNEDELENFMSNSSYQEEVVDSLLNYFSLEANMIKRYTTGLNTRLMVQFDYNLNDKHRFSALVQAARVGRILVPSLTLAYSASFTEWVDLSVAYTLMKNSYDNLGIGLGFNLKVVTIFATCENIIPAINRTRLSNPNFQFGIVFNWKKKVSDSATQASIY